MAEESTDDPLAAMACPNCGMHKIRPSFPRGIDGFLRFIGLNPFRCRGCRARFRRFWEVPKQYREGKEDEDEDEDEDEEEG